jgi:hypothetical protein
MRFILVVRKRNELNARWEERYDARDVKTIKQAEEFGLRLVRGWNSTALGRDLRVLAGVKCLGGSVSHEWLKTNLVTQVAGGSQFDSYRCSVCGVTGKRLGLSSCIVRDQKYNDKKYATCAWKKLKG